jgi:hypothetical protein
VLSGAKGRRPWPRKRGDLPPVTRPEITADQWREPGQALDRLRTWAEDRATETITWYLRDKQNKRSFSRLLRAAAVVLAVAGGVLPLISSSTGGISPNLGYVFLAVAAGCVAFDHFFGLSAGWMRDIATLQALQSRLARFQLDWARWQAVQAGAGTDRPATDVVAALDLIDELVTSVAQLTEAETTQWITDFSSSVAALRQQASPSVTSPQDLITWGNQGGVCRAEPVPMGCFRLDLC